MYFAKKNEHTIPLFINAKLLPLNFLYYKTLSELMHDVSTASSPINIQYCAKVMQTKFVEIRPLFLRLFYEKSSNFRKTFRRGLREKIMIFVENSRERNSK